MMKNLDRAATTYCTLLGHLKFRTIRTGLKLALLEGYSRCSKIIRVINIGFMIIFLGTFFTNTMVELSIRKFLDIDFDLVQIPLVISNFFAMHSNR